jgi:general secretion pathway protein E
LILADAERDVMMIEPLITGARAVDIPYAFAQTFGVVLLGDGQADELAVALREGADPRALFEVRRELARPLAVAFVSPAEFDQHIAAHYSNAETSVAIGGALEGTGSDRHVITAATPTERQPADGSDDASAVRLINGIVAEAVRQGVSDIHVEPHDTGLVVRMRIDGVLRETLRLPPHMAPLVVRRIKQVARLDAADPRTPQDGRIRLSAGDKLRDVRVSTLPSRAGERVVLRILDEESAGSDVGLLGMAPDVEEGYRAALAEQSGIILVTGTTGSGKTTSLYAGLRLLNDGTRNILTVEDPVEYPIEGVGQIQVNSKVGLTFTAGLRAILRQDPDVIMIGEIRDHDTAELAVQASLTGRLVLSTVHSSDAVGAITRMRDLKVERFLLASTLRAVIAQRLVRRLCPECREPVQADDSIAARLGFDAGAVIYHPRGCESCNHSGFDGKIGVFEMIRVDDTIRKLIHDGGDEAIIARHAFLNSRNLGAAARALVRAGETTAEEAIRVSRREVEDG